MSILLKGNKCYLLPKRIKFLCFFISLLENKSSRFFYKAFLFLANNMTAKILDHRNLCLKLIFFYLNTHQSLVFNLGLFSCLSELFLHIDLIQSSPNQTIFRYLLLLQFTTDYWLIFYNYFQKKVDDSLDSNYETLDYELYCINVCILTIFGLQP